MDRLSSKTTQTGTSSSSKGINSKSSSTVFGTGVSGTKCGQLGFSSLLGGALTPYWLNQSMNCTRMSFTVEKLG